MTKDLETLALYDLKSYAEREATRVDDINGGMLCRTCVEESANVIEQALERKEKLEKFVEIIKAKKPLINILCWAENVGDYNDNAEVYGRKTLTEEEYDLLKEVLQ